MLATGAFAQAQRSQRVVACISTGTEVAYRHLFAEFRRGLRDLGYQDGQDIVIEERWSEDRPERLRTLVAEIVRQKPAVIVTHGSPGVAALQKATSTIPVVFASAGDPVGQGFVASFRRPGGNITGIAFNDEINEKLYELVKEILPSALRIATLVNENNPAMKHHLAIVPKAAKALRFESIKVSAADAASIEPAFKRAIEAHAQALIAPPLSPYVSNRALIVELQGKFRLPTFFGQSEAVHIGGLASYSFPQEESYYRSAALVDKILKGADPAQLPVEIPTKYEIVLNLKAAKSLGIKLAPAMLLRANKVIE